MSEFVAYLPLVLAGLAAVYDRLPLTLVLIAFAFFQEFRRWECDCDQGDEESDDGERKPNPKS